MYLYVYIYIYKHTYIHIYIYTTATIILHLPATAVTMACKTFASPWYQQRMSSGNKQRGNWLARLTWKSSMKNSVLQ